jgi:O-acetylhomoserine (thiol)-lyase
VLEKRVAALEGGVGALCVGSGQAALNYAILNVTEMGSNIVSVPQLYGTTSTLFCHTLPRLGVTAKLSKDDQPASIEALIDENTKAVFCESVGNPAGNICDIEAFAKVAHKHGVPLIVDNTVATPILLRPFEYGADVVVHSLTKFMGGHGTTMGGAVVDSGNFPWLKHASRFPMFTQPDASYHGLVYAEHFGRTAYIERCRSVLMRTTGSVLAPINAFLLLQGVETVAMWRMRARWRSSCAKTDASTGSTTRAFRTAPITHWHRNTCGAVPVRSLPLGCAGATRVGCASTTD